MSKSPFSSTAFRDAVKNGRLAVVTRQNYESRLSTMQHETGNTVHHMVRHPSETYQAILRKSADVPQTIRSYLTAFMAVFKHDPKLASRKQDEYQKFRSYFRKVDKVVQERYDNNEPNDKQREAYIPLNDVIQKRDQLLADSPEYLVLCLYTMIPPLRADFGNVRILSREPQGAAASTGNYLVVREKYMRLVLNEFKSKSKSLSQYNKVLPVNLEAVIRHSLSNQPRSHLIVSPRTGLPFLRDNTYVVHVHRIMERAIGKKVSISMLRHIYVNSLDYNKMTSGQKAQISADMLHSVSTNDRYRLHF